MRNYSGLTPEEIDKAQEMWEFITEDENETLKAENLNNLIVSMDISEAKTNGSRTRFIEPNTVMLGADAYPGKEEDPNSKMSLLACLCHEFAHAQRYHMGFDRPFEEPMINLDEAETSIHASHTPALYLGDKKMLVHDAKLRLDTWERKL